MTGIEVSPSTLHREARRQGERAIAVRDRDLRLAGSPAGRNVLESSCPPVFAGNTLIIEMDAWNIRERDYWGETQKRRKDEEETGRWHWVYTGTIFQDTKKPLSMWFRAMWHVIGQKHGGNALGLQRTLDLGSYRTAWSWLHKLRRAMVRPGRDRLSGVVETDETYLGGAKSGPRGRGADGKSLVLIMAQAKGKHLGRIRLAHIADASADSLEAAVRQGVEPGSEVVTDGWTGYQGMQKAGYIHTVARPEACVGDDLLPLPHLVASLLKRWILGTYQGSVSPAHLAYYLDEFTFRFNRRTSASRGKLFFRLAQQALTIGPVPLDAARSSGGITATTTSSG